MIQDTTVLLTIGVWDWLPIKLKERLLFSLINVSVIDSFNSLEFKTKKMFQCYLWVTVTKWVSCPSDFVDVPKLFIHPIHTNSILIQNIFVITHCFIIFNPTTVWDIKLTIFQEFFDLLFLTSINILIPVFEKDDFRDEIFTLFI